MDSFELNKVAGAVLLCLLVVMGVKTVGDVIFEVRELETMGYDVSGLALEKDTTTEEEPEPEQSFPAVLATADPERGSRVFRRCMSCHTVEEGGANKIGPNLWNVVGNEFGHKDDFSYSDIFQQARSEGRHWSYEDLSDYLEAPADYLPGNKMAFAGLSDIEQRANVIAYLAQNSPDAPPLPEAPAAEGGEASGESAPAAEAAPAEAEDAPAEGETDQTDGDAASE